MKRFWELLSQVSDLDVKPWPEDIPENPENPLWEFCYDDERYFVYCGTPAHTNRQSRSFPYFMLAMTPRWVLDQWNAHPKKAAAIGPKIRERLAEYDAVPAHPELKQYGSQGNLEYKQYFLRDDDTSLLGVLFFVLFKRRRFRNSLPFLVLKRPPPNKLYSADIRRSVSLTGFRKGK